VIEAVERTFRHLIAMQMKAKKNEDAGMGWWLLFLGALSRPLSLFIRVYGIYWALSPILTPSNPRKRTPSSIAWPARRPTSAP